MTALQALKIGLKLPVKVLDISGLQAGLRSRNTAQSTYRDSGDEGGRQIVEFRRDRPPASGFIQPFSPGPGEKSRAGQRCPSGMQAPRAQSSAAAHQAVDHEVPSIAP